MRRFVIALAAVAVPATVRAAEDFPPNAALQYWQAFAMLPEGLNGDRLTEAERKCVGDWETAPLDETAAAAIKKYAYSLGYFHRGAAIPGCAWASQSDLRRDGSGTLTPELAGTHRLKAAALLRARYRFAHGQPRRALDDLFALVRFARHLEGGSTLIGVLTGYGVERDAFRVLAANMGTIAADADLLAATRAKWDKLPPPRPMVEAIRAERDGLVGMFRYHAGLDPKNPPDDEIGTPIGFIPTLAFLVGNETFEQSVATLCDTVGRHYDRLIQATAVAPDKILDAEKSFFDQWTLATANDDPIAVGVTKQLFPAVGRLRLSEAEMFSRRAMVRAAMAVAANGPDALKMHTDPYGGTPFTTRPVAGGYELKSQLSSVLNKPVILVVRTAKAAP